MIARALAVSLCLVLGSVLIHRAAATERPVLPRDPLASLPLAVGDWSGRASRPLDPAVLGVLKVDDYVNRVYVGEGGTAVSLYVGYYASQRDGETMHSPLNCLPGGGWEPIARRRIPIATGAVVNRLTIRKGLDTQVVLYWYASHGRIVASEYWGKVQTVLDAIRLHRTDAALVRIIAPVPERTEHGEAIAETAAVEFAGDLLPLLARYLPD